MSDTILIIDTATENCSAALHCNGQLFEDCAEVPREHSQRILPMVDSLLKQADISLSQIDVLAFGRGPGSFTGIRIGTAMVQGLALGADLKVIPLSNLAAMAQGAIDAGAVSVVAAIDARMGEVYFGHYVAEDGIAKLEGDEVVIKPDQLQSQLDAIAANTIAVGTGFETYPQLINNTFITVDPECRLPTAAMMLPLAVTAWNANGAISVDDVEPVYLRNEVTWNKLPGRG